MSRVSVDHFNNNVWYYCIAPNKYNKFPYRIIVALGIGSLKIKILLSGRIYHRAWMHWNWTDCGRVGSRNYLIQKLWSFKVDILFRYSLSVIFIRTIKIRNPFDFHYNLALKFKNGAHLNKGIIVDRL